MKAITIHPGSALVGAAMLGIVTIATGAYQVSVQTAKATLVTKEIRVTGIPDPRDIIAIEQGQPYVVPAKRSFVVLALGASAISGGNKANLLADSVQVLSTSQSDTGQPSLSQVTPHIVAGPGVTLEVTGNMPSSRALGYLIDE